MGATSREPTIREMPSSVMVELTNRCQLRCITCPREYDTARPFAAVGDMPLARFRTLAETVLRHCRTVGLSGGGETFLHPHVEEAVEYLLELNPAAEIFVSTNALAPRTAAIAGRLAGRLATLQVSIDGTGAAYERIRVGARWDAFRASLDALLAATADTRTQISFNMVLLPDNLVELLPVLRLAAELGIQQVSATPVNLVCHPWDTEIYARLVTAEARKTVDEARQFAAGHRIAFTTFDLRSAPGFAGCPFPWNHFYITWDGFLVPCCAKPLPRLLHFGNVFERPFMDCVNDPGFVDFRTLAQRGVAPDFCHRCHFLPWGSDPSPVPITAPDDTSGRTDPTLATRLRGILRRLRGGASPR